MTTPALPNAPARHMTQALLPWESEDDFLTLHEDWRAAYKPHGPAESALVDQLVWIDWRRRRLVLGERALHVTQVHSRTSTGTEYRASDALVRRATVDRPGDVRHHNSRAALSTAPGDDAILAADAADDLAQTTAALKRLDAGDAGAFVEALAYLRNDSREWWESESEEDCEQFPENAEGLRNFIDYKLIPTLEGMKQEAEERPSVRLQAWGESLDPNRMNTLFALDERLGRQFEKAMGMLLKLQKIRGGKTGC